MQGKARDAGGFPAPGGGVARGAGKGRFFFYVREDPWPAMRGMVDVWLRLLVLGSFAHPRMWKVFFPTRGKEPKGARGQPIRASTMAAPRTPRRLVWVRNLLLRKANTFLAGAAWNNFRCHACRPLAAGRHRWAALVARGLVGFGSRLMADCSFARGTGMRGVLSHSRERTKGRPVAANPSQHHGCPRTPRRLDWRRNLMWSEANCFLAGAAWNGFRGYVCRPLAAGRHQWAALVAREVVSLWLCLMARGTFARRAGMGVVLSHSRERTKGRPGAANPSQHHGCPRTPRRLG